MAGSQVESDLTPPVEEKLDFNSDALRAKAEAYKNEGNDEYRKKEYSNAIQIYTEGIEVNCKDDELNAQLYTNRATAHFCLANYQASLADARSAVELQPTYIKAILKGASACVELRLYEEAITWCDKGLAIEEENKPLLDLKSSSVDELNLRAMAEVYKNEGNSAYGGKDLVGAIDFYTQAINVKCKDDELNAKLYSNRATAYFHQANYQSSLADARSAVELQPTYIKAISKGASACVELGLYEEAVTWCDKGLAIEEDNKLLLDLKNRSVDELNSRAMAEVYKKEGNSAYGKKDLVSAIDFYTQGIDLKCKDDELNAKLYSNRATAYFHQGSYQETIADARAAVDLQPTYVKAIERGASACIKLKRYEEAITWCDKGLAIEKQNKALLDLRKKSVDERTEADMTGSFPGGARGFPVGSGGFPGGAEGFPGALGAGGFPEAVTGGGETPILNDLFSDKELLAAFQDPTVMAAFQDISQNPENISKYPNNRKLKTIIDKLDKKFGPPGSGPPPSSGGGFPGGVPFGNMFGGP